MKNLILIFMVSIFFLACSTKERVVEIKYPPTYKQKQDLEEEKIKEETQIEENIEGLDSKDSIIEEESIINEDSVHKLALTYPSLVIGKYAKTATNTVVGYYTYKNVKYQIKAFDSLRESIASVQKAFDKLKNQGFTKVIALYSINAIDILNSIDTDGLEIYLPLISKNEVSSIKDNFVYGAISYIDQIKKLNEFSNINNVMFYQESYLGKKLRDKYSNIITDVKVVKSIDNKRNYFKGLVKDYRLNNSSLFLNTNIIKTAILLSQIRVYSMYPKVVLSTQQNYNPKILSLTQEKDRENFVVANSIEIIDEQLEDTISNLGGDVKFNWVDYSVLIGTNYLFDKNATGLIKNFIEDNQVIYEPKLYRATDYGFEEIK